MVGVDITDDEREVAEFVVQVVYWGIISLAAAADGGDVNVPYLYGAVFTLDLDCEDF